MFATLDPTVRPLILPSRRRVLVSDTVGFIRNLPTTLVKAFRATLEEVNEAALILHVVDASSPAAEEHTAHVLKVLAEIGAAQVPQILVLNKIDRLDSAEADAGTLQRRLLGGAGGHAEMRAVAISAVTGTGMDALLAAIDDVLPLDPLVRTHAGFERRRRRHPRHDPRIRPRALHAIRGESRRWWRPRSPNRWNGA